MTPERTGPNPYLIERASAPRLEIGAETLLTGRAALTDGAYCVMDQLIAPKALASPHSHELEDQASIVLEGELGFWIDGEEFFAAAGDYVYRPAGKPHALWNPTEGVARIQEITSPGARFEEYMVKLSEMIASGGADPEAVKAHADRYGVRFLDDGTEQELAARHGVSPAGNFWK